jgi:hypothetical protein
MLAALGVTLTAQGRESSQATLRVTANERHVPMFVEGYVVKLRLTRGDNVILRKTVPGGRHRLIRDLALAKGAYKLHVALHSCDGNCGILDRAWSHCSGQVEAQAGERLGVDVGMHHPHCRMLFSVGVAATG